MAVYKHPKKNCWCAHFRYTDWTGARKQKKREGFKTKREAAEWEREYLQQINGSTTMTFRSLVQNYMEDSRARLRETTCAQKQFIFDKKILPYFGDLALESITVNTVRTWQNTLLTDEHNYSLTYLKTVHNQLSAAFNFAVKHYGLKENPAAKCGAMGKKKADTMLFWTLDEFRKFIKAFDKDLLAKTIFNLLYWTGMREGEALALTQSDFDFEENIVSITKTYTRLEGRDIISQPKTPKSRRNIVMPQHLSDLVKEYCDAQYDLMPDDRVFSVTKSYLYHQVRKGCEISGVKVIRVHDLRHSHASLLIEMGYSPLLIAERLGHENIETTLQTYSHLYPNKQGELAVHLDDLF